MCLAVFALDAHPLYSTVIAANRDEHHARDAVRAQWWSEGWLGGRDLRGGGTWLGITRSGRWAFLTNVREPSRHDPDAPTRGALVTTVLTAVAAPMDTLRELALTAGNYNGFNLLVGEDGDAAWLSNRAAEPRPLGPGIHGISNAALDTPWPKVVATRQAVDAWCRSGASDTTALFDALASRDIAPDDRLPRTGVPLERERWLSAAFIVSPEYGTRSSTVVLIGRDGVASFEERSFDAGGQAVDVATHRFTLVAGPAPRLSGRAPSPGEEFRLR